MLALVSCDRTDVPAPQARHVVEVWHAWPEQEAVGLQQAVDAFERTHPDIHVRLSFSANNLTSNQKLFLAIAGGVAPDVTFVDGQQLAEWAARGALEDITDAVAAQGVKPDDFWKPRWDESVFQGRVYALPVGADPNFALVWNKQLFREAGLDPEKPPRTIEELDACNDKLFHFDAKGRMDRTGLTPWEWGGDNSFFNWAYAFGGEVYVPAADGNGSGRVTADDPHNVEAMRWMRRTADRYGGVRAIAQFNSNFVGAANNPFYLGKVGMTLMHVSQVRLMKKYAPTIEYGVGFIPAPPGGEYPSCWIGGWSLAVPRGRPVKPETVTFMRWLSASDEGSHFVGQAMRVMPAYRKSTWFNKARENPDIAAYYTLLENAKHVRTLMPAQGYLMDLLRRANNDILYGNRDAAEALKEVNVKAQSRLEEVLETVKQRKNTEQTSLRSPLPVPRERARVRASSLDTASNQTAPILTLPREYTGEGTKPVLARSGAVR